VVKGNRAGYEDRKAALKDIAQDAKSRERISVESLARIGKSVDAARLFVAVLANTGFGPAEAMNELNFGDFSPKTELLAYHLYPFFGVSQEKQITPWHTNECMDVLDELFRAHLQHRMFARMENRRLTAVSHLAGSVRMYAEIVRGSAYPEQTADEIISIQAKFERWFTKRIGVGPKRAQEILFAIIRAQENAYNSSRDDFRERGKSYQHLWMNAREKSQKNRSEEDTKLLEFLGDEKSAFVFGCVERLNEISWNMLPVGPDDLDFLDTKPSPKEWSALRSLIGLTPENRKIMSKHVEVRQRPLFVMPDERVVLVDVSNALDVLWERFEEVAKTDQPFYDKRYQRIKARWLEDKVSEYLLRIFPAQYVYQKLSYPDPDKGGGSTAELDTAVYWRPFLVLVEAKARQFRMESQMGDIGRLVTDVKANVEDAFEQARRALRYIDSVESAEFTETSTGRRLSFRRQAIRRVYLITVSQHHLAELANNLEEFESFGLFKEHEYPLSVCASDLDIISQFCDGPDVFLHYVERRFEILRDSVRFMTPELDAFGAYLDNRLHPEKILRADGKPLNGVTLSGFQDKFDDWMKYKRGDIERSPDIKLEIPPEISEILTELRARRKEDGARWIAFALLGMSDRGLEALAKMVWDLRKANLTPGMFRRIVHQEEDIVISLVASLDLPPQVLRDSTLMRTQIEKYRQKVLKSIGIGIMVKDTSRAFDCAIWLEGPWQHDENMEKLMVSEPPFLPAPGQKLPGRNAPCICGSGKKFKKCCLPKIEDARRKGLQ
jgi:hypothetical protein